MSTRHLGQLSKFDLGEIVEALARSIAERHAEEDAAQATVDDRLPGMPVSYISGVSSVFADLKSMGIRTELIDVGAINGLQDTVEKIYQSEISRRWPS